MTKVLNSLLPSFPGRALKSYADLLQLQPPHGMLDNRLSKKRAFQGKLFRAPRLTITVGGAAAWEYKRMWVLPRRQRTAGPRRS
jgi:hypothetical protein